MSATQLETMKTLVEVGSTILTTAGSLAGGLLSLKFARSVKQDMLAKIDTSNIDKASKENIKSTLQKWSFYAITSSILLAIVATLIVGVAVWQNFLVPPHPTELSQFLSIHDPELFPNAGDRSYEIARIFPDRRSLSTEANLGATIARTTTSFDLLVEHGSSVIIEYRKDITDALARGVNFRVILLDPEEVVRGTHDKMIEVTTSGGQDFKERRDAFLARIRQVESALKDIDREATDREFQGKLTYKLNSMPILYRMWLRDISKPEKAMAHVTIHQYRSNAESPSFRFTYRESQRLMDNIHKDFERAWELAKSH